MAAKTSFYEGAMMIAEAIHAYADRRRWGSGDYHIFMIFNTDYFMLRVEVVGKGFDGRSEEQEQTDYDDVMDLIEKRLKGRRIFNGS